MLKSVLLAGGALLAPVSAFAQTAPAPDAATPVRDDRTIVVTANRSPAGADRIAASVTVLDKAEIDRAGDQTVADLLLRTPGVTLSRNGGIGTATSLRLRGAEGDQTLLVVDGVRVNDPSSPGGGFDFGNLLVGDATRIEVLRGPQSTLWGSQAIGGVVNIVTPLPAEDLEGSIDLEAGSRQTASGRGAVGGRTGALSWRVAGQAFTTDGISAQANGTERDGYHNRTASGRALLDIATGLSAEVRGTYTDARVELDGFAGDSDEYSLTDQVTGYAGLNLDLFGGRLRNRVGYSYSRIDRDNLDPASTPDATFVSSGRSERAEYQGTLAIADRIEAVFGAENEWSRFRSESPAFGSPQVGGRAEITSVYGQLSAGLSDGLTLTGGVRHDDHSRFGSQTLLSAGGVWALSTGTVLRASYGEGFKAPTLYQLFSEYGNQALDPEQASGWEAGAEQRFLDGRLTLGATYFERRSRGLITFASCFGVAADPLCLVPGSTTQQRFGYYLNVARAFASGVEASGRLAIGERFSLDGNYSWTVSEDRSAGSANFGRQLARRPRNAWNAGINYTVPDALTLGAAVRHSGQTFDNAANSVRLAPYTLVDLRAELPLSPEVRLFVRGENVLDEQYRTVFGFGTLGRSIYAGVRGRF